MSHAPPDPGPSAFSRRAFLKGASVAAVTTAAAGAATAPPQQPGTFAPGDAMQCGFCTPGMVMSSYACLQQRGKPTREQMQHDLAGNICRCGTYGRIFEAIQRTAAAGKDGGK